MYLTTCPGRTAVGVPVPCPSSDKEIRAQSAGGRRQRIEDLTLAEDEIIRFTEGISSSSISENHTTKL
jgi:hypothetical protein